MSFLGIDVTEWAAFIAVISAIISLIGWSMKKFVIDPLMEQISHLSDTIQGLTKQVNSRYEEQQKHLTHEDDRLDKHDVKLENHDTRITNLENINDIRKEGTHEHSSNY